MRGLKFLFLSGLFRRQVAPYAGAWIEMPKRFTGQINERVAPYAGAWIEILGVPSGFTSLSSHPTRVRGLKFLKCLADSII